MQKSSRLTGLVLVLVGAMVLTTNLGKPRVKGLRGSDVLGLVASGGLFGVGFIALMNKLRVGNE